MSPKGSRPKKAIAGAKAKRKTGTGNKAASTKKAKGNVAKGKGKPKDDHDYESEPASDIEADNPKQDNSEEEEVINCDNVIVVLPAKVQKRLLSTLKSITNPTLTSKSYIQETISENDDDEGVSDDDKEPAGTQPSPTKRSPAKAKDKANPGSRAKSKAAKDREVMQSNEEEDADSSEEENEDEGTKTATKRRLPTKAKQTPNPAVRAKKVAAELKKENEELKAKLANQQRALKEQKATIEEDELRNYQIKRYVKEFLWKRVKWITDDVILQKTLDKCARHFQIVAKDVLDWKIRHSKEVQNSLNVRRNNCVQDMAAAYKGNHYCWC